MKLYGCSLVAALFAMFALSAASQNRVSGTLLDSKTYENIPYVIIGIDDKQTGSVSDSVGYFTLHIGKRATLTDSVTFYHPNYEQLNICHNDLLNSGNRIYLTAKEPLLNQTNQLKPGAEIILGKDRIGAKMLQANFFAVNEINGSDRVSREMGMIFKLKTDYLLKTVNFYIGKNDHKRVKFRLSFYSVENNFPKDLIVNNDIVCSVDNKYEGWVKIDLRPYNIYITNRKAIAVTLTILESELNNNRNLLSILGSIQPNTLVIREKAFDIWKSISGQTLAIYFECNELSK